MTPQALPLGHLAGCSEEAFVSHLGSVFEHAPWVAASVAKRRPFHDGGALHAAMMQTLRELPEAQLVELLRGHPELAGAQARAGTMTSDSQSEQGSLALGAIDDESAERWDRLNAQYSARFGFPFILCIRRHTRASALRAFERRLMNDRVTELRNALGEIARISRLRLAARLADHGFDDIAGKLCVQVVDMSGGDPRGAVAHGLQVELFEASGGTSQRLLATTIEGEETALLHSQPLRVGRYELRLHAGSYFASRAAASAATRQESDEPFLDIVPIAFGIDAPESELKLRISLTPWSYAIYRGA